MRARLIAISIVFLVLSFVLGQQEAFAQRKIYWTAGGNGPVGQIQSANLDGTNLQTLVANTNALGSSRPGGIALDLDGGKLYWADWAGGVYAANLDGTSPGVIAMNPAYALQGIAVAGGELYWGPTHASFGGDSARIRKSNLDGSSVTVLVQNAVSWFPGMLAVDATGGKMYWGAPGYFAGPPYALRWANLNGSGVQTIGNLPVRGIDVDAAGGKIYFTTAPPFGGGGAIYSANLNGTGLVLVIGGLNFPYGIAVDPGTGKIYWSDINQGVIREANIDGSSQAVLIPGLVSPGGIALQPTIDVSVDVKPGSFPSSINLRSKGVTPVAIHTTPDFDATTVKPSTAMLFDSDDLLIGVEPVMWDIYDCDELPNPLYGDPLFPNEPEMIGDGDIDLVLYFDTPELAVIFEEGTIEATITAETYDGVPLIGTGDVRIVVKGKP